MWGSMLDKMSQLMDAKKDKNFSLIRDYSDDRWSTIRQVATTILAENGDPIDVEYMYKRVCDSHYEVQQAALYGLDKLCTKDAIPQLKALQKIEKDKEIKKELDRIIHRINK